MPRLLKYTNTKLKLNFNFFDHQILTINISKIRTVFWEENYTINRYSLPSNHRISNITRKGVKTKGGKLQREQENKKRN